ncbi:hypothetical protein GCM10023185_09380 [Hymenobacter saemangeumensis]|uniref:histidine kinase n=1 Tax=Hymenobacter saemangeumensis TaxID=1084522 RepID=A0ABP8I470_9BACT
MEKLAQPGQPPLLRSMALRQLGQLYINDHKGALGVQRLLAGYQLLESQHDTVRLVEYATFVSWGYILLSQPEQGRQFAQAALRYAGPHAEPLTLGRIYNVLAMAEGLRHDYQAEISGYRRACQEALRAGNRQHAAVYLGNLIQPYLTLGRLAEARRVMDSALLVRPPFKQIDYYIKSDEAELLYREGRYAEAVQAARLIQQYCIGWKDYNLLCDALRTLAPALARLGQHEEAYAAQLRLTQINDSLYESSSIARMQEMQALYESEKQLAQLARQRHRISGLDAAAALREADLRRRTTLLYALLTGAALLLALAATLYNRNRLKQQANAILSTQKAELAVAAGKLQALNATKDRLFAIVAHDLRNPLAALTGIQTIIQRYVRRGEPERLVELGDHLQQTAQTLYGVLDNVLGWAVSQSGDLEPRPELLDVSLLLREALSIGQLQATAQEIELRVDAADDLYVTADRQMLRTLLRNLLGNALKFTPIGGQVTLTAEAEEDSLVFRITDTGPGFSAAAAVAWATAEVGPRTADASGRTGVGLGLVVCRAFTRQLGGQLSWRNRAEGGAEVTLSLPLAQPIAVPA